MDRLRGRVGAVLRDMERHGQPGAAMARPLPGPPPRYRPTIDREGADAEPQAGEIGATPPPAPPAPPIAPTRGTDLRAALGSRAALRRAFFLREILGPPRALQDPRDDGRV